MQSTFTRETSIIEVEITVRDYLYYASTESGDRFGTKPFLLHTALYYAFGFFPSRFRTAENTPSYRDHRDESRIGQDAYIHPAIATHIPGYETRQFSVNGDAPRSRRKNPPSRNLQETGKQKYIRPGATFRTFITTFDTELASRILDEIPRRIRVGKKMSTATVRTELHTDTSTRGVFTLGQPVAREDLQMDTYNLEGNIRYEAFPQFNLLKSATFTGPYLSVTSVFTDGDDTEIELPANTRFLGTDT